MLLLGRGGRENEFFLANTSREPHGLVDARKANVKVGDKGMDVIAPLDVELEIGDKVELLLLDGENVDDLDRAGIADDRVLVDRVHQGFAQCKLLDAAKVETVHLVPDCTHTESMLREEQA